MFGLLFELVHFTISIVYPLHQSYKAIQTDISKDITPWLIYWIVLALFINLQQFLNPIIRFIPFNGTIKIYLLVWLVFPILDRNDYKLANRAAQSGTPVSAGKINGAQIIWDFYIIPFLLNFDNRLTEFINLNFSNVKKIFVNLFNLVIDTWFKGNESLKIFGSYDEVPEKDESFMGSVYVILKDSKFFTTPPESTGTTITSKTVSESAASINAKGLTILKSLLSIIPYNGVHNEESSHAEAVTKDAGSSVVDPTQSSNEEFDIVDTADIHESDSDGSETSNGWFKWRGSRTTGALTTPEGQ